MNTYIDLRKYTQYDIETFAHDVIANINYVRSKGYNNGPDAQREENDARALINGTKLPGISIYTPRLKFYLKTSNKIVKYNK